VLLGSIRPGHGQMDSAGDAAMDRQTRPKTQRQGSSPVNRMAMATAPCQQRRWGKRSGKGRRRREVGAFIAERGGGFEYVLCRPAAPGRWGDGWRIGQWSARGAASQWQVGPGADRWASPISFKFWNFLSRLDFVSWQLHFLNSKIYQILWGHRRNKKEQLSFWWKIQIPNWFWIKNSGTNQDLNFYGHQTF
jgi:hypothetical protein